MGLTGKSLVKNCWKNCLKTSKEKMGIMGGLEMGLMGPTLPKGNQPPIKTPQPGQGAEGQG